MSDEIDILNELNTLDLTTVETEYPILKAGIYEGTIAEAKVERNKKETGSNLNLKITLNHATQSEVNSKGVTRDINAGFPIFDTISLVRTFKDDGVTIKYDPLPRIAAFAKACGVTTLMPVEQLIGKVVTFKLKVVEETGEFAGRKNRMDKYVAKA